MEDSSHLGPFAAGSGMHRCNASSEGDRDINIPAPPSAREKKGIDAILNEAVTSVNANGPMHSIEWDAVRIASWAIIASSGAVSKTHHDASGYSTYVKCEMGAKIWGYVLPKKPSHSLDQSMKEYHRMVTKCTETSELAKVAEPVNIYLPRGTLLIQPPGALHLVYTLERSIFTCGHFYTLESMHLTEVARACAACTNQRGTNASHPGSARVLSRIALSLVFDWHPSGKQNPPGYPIILKLQRNH
ncbi:hypothetical protein BDY19DRAFT_342648 [Irpex rosettiformis]|uniref:Uncharacterized protein n=1 Tax=Irpex rosettiformis TaxID=378272 RepID=A0ACB8TXI5_9APHY|nr:hypothetical protein BDY19DRAFT_342648 [Irpex rosettiformis]